MNTNPKCDTSDKMEMGGYVIVEVIRDTPQGPRVIERRVSHNLIVNVGKKQMWRKATGLSVKLWKFMRIGTSANAAASNQTNLVSPITSTLKTVDSFTMSGATRTFAWIISYPSGVSTKTVTGIKEVILGDQHTSPGGSILMRALISPAVNKTTHDKFRITYKARVT